MLAGGTAEGQIRAMTLRHGSPAFVAAVLLAACSKPAPPAAPGGEQQATSTANPQSSAPAAPAAPSPTAGTAEAPASPAVNTIANKIWKVVKSSAVDTGTYYVFLGDGTMLVTSPHGTPAVGSWRHSGEMLTLVEEGLPHPATVVHATPDTLAIRIAGPGAPVSITFVPVTAQ